MFRLSSIFKVFFILPYSEQQASSIFATRASSLLFRAFRTREYFSPTYFTILPLLTSRISRISLELIEFHCLRMSSWAL